MTGALREFFAAVAAESPQRLKAEFFVDGRDVAVPVAMEAIEQPVRECLAAGHNVAQAVIPSQQREYLASSVSIYSHVKMKLEIVNASKSQFRASLVQPPGSEPVSYAVTLRGIEDAD